MSNQCADHFLYLVVRLQDWICCTEFGSRVTLKRLTKITSRRVGAASAHCVEVAVGREEYAHGAHRRTGHIGTCRPSLGARPSAHKFVCADVGRDRVTRIIVDIEQHTHGGPTMV